MATRIAAVLVLVLLPTLAFGGGVNRNYLVPSFQNCAGPSVCPPQHDSSFTFDSAVLKTPVSRFLRSRKTAFTLELRGVRDAAGNLVSGAQFTVVLATGQVTVPGVGTFPEGALPDTRIPFTVERGKADVVYKSPDVPRGTVVEGGVVTVIDPDGKRLATIGSQAKP
jgi:hypothetical protein